MSEKSTAVVIVGASGDLARRKLIPALAKLAAKGVLDKSAVVVGTGRSEFTDEAFRSRFEAPSSFASQLFYHQGLTGLKTYLDGKGTFDRVVFFLAQPPEAYAATAGALHAEGFGDRAVLVIEKPFGYDFASALALDRCLHGCFDESQIFRIDHYLAKEAVQNIMVFRFANSVFYPIWNSRYISSIQINAFEDIGVGDRGAYFDKAGIIRDMVQNHLLQLLCLLTMEAPVTLDSEDIQAQKLSVLKAMEVAECRRFQYEGYRQERGVAPDSQTETYAEMKLYIHNFRWTGMPVYIRTGKCLNRKGTEIGVQIKPLPRLLFNKNGEIEANRIIFKIQPAEGIILDMPTKIPGSDLRVTNTTMQFCYRDSFGGEIPEAYQKLLLDALRGDRTLFVSAEETETAWKKVEPFLGKGDVGHYAKGTVPPLWIARQWIDFEKYGSVCA